MTFIRNNWREILIVGLVLFIGFFNRNPFGCNKPAEPTRDTVTNVVYVPQPPVTIPQYIPVQTGSSAPIVLPPQYVQLPADTAALGTMIRDLASKYFAQNTYKDSIPLRDSSGRRVGVVNLEDMVSENQIKLRKPSYQLTFPHTTTTITITQPYQPKRQLYVGGGIFGNDKEYIKQAQAGFLYKNKKDQIFGVKGGWDFTGRNWLVGIESYWKIGKKPN